MTNSVGRALRIIAWANVGLATVLMAASWATGDLSIWDVVRLAGALGAAVAIHSASQRAAP